MGINITQTMGGYQFENRENQRNTAKEIFSKQGATDESLNEVMDKTIFSFSNNNTNVYSNVQLSIIKAASQINVNDSLKETLKYLKSHTAKRQEKEYVLGELWDMFTKEQKEYENTIDLEIDFSAENIFAA